ncbi:MAG: hypothetical protein KKC50_08280 [Candidatus Omnitrophica bacterium]|nr:hypothetical protein [Candidatus Omnitrophota bacterium]
MAKDNASYSEENGGTIIFEGPSANLKGGWLELIVQEYQNHSRAIMSMDSNEDGIKAHYCFLKLINTLPQKKGKRGTRSRERLYDYYKALMKKRMKEAQGETGSNLSDADKARVRMETELETIGHISDYVQKYIGIEEELTIDHVGAGLGK